MHHNLLINDDSQSENSFDSSEISSTLSRTASLLSIVNLETLQQKFMTPKVKTRSIDSNLSERTQSIQQPRIQVHSQKHFLQHQPEFQLGFFIGKDKKTFQLNQSKIKKGIHFFDDDSPTSNTNLFPNHSLFEYPQTANSNILNQEMSDFSIPCFKNIGKKNKLQIDPNLLQKGKNFFDDQFQEKPLPNISKRLIPPQNQLLSFVKPTKVKKTFTTPNMQEQNYIKTVNVNKKQKKQQVQKIQKKQVFDWNKFQVSSKKLFLNQVSYKISAEKAGQKSKSKSRKKIIFELISFKDLREQAILSKQKMQEFKERLYYINEKKFDHIKKDCNVVKCIICDLKVQDTYLDQEKLEEIYSQKLVLQKIETTKFQQLYEQICFKLFKYQTFFFEVHNKRLEASNILVEMHKKSKIVQSGTPFLGWMDFCISENKFYHSFIAEVRELYHSDKINTYFILLADGWSSVWAVVTEKNSLYKFVQKLTILSKIFIGYWKHYSLANVLTFCPQAKKGQKCIEIWYNSTIIVKHNMNIGKPKSLIFYRPLNLVQKEGGIIPTVQGIIIRMFCFNAPKMKSFACDQNTFNENYVQIITPEGFTTLIKFILSSERSLAELFRLYFKYQFYFLKIGQKDNILQFNDGVSKVFEFDKKDKNEYDSNLIAVLRKRYINSMNEKSLDELEIGKWYDLRLEGKQGNLNRRIFVIDQANDSENTNSYLKGSSLLYQQYELKHIEKNYKNEQGKQKIQYFLKKTRFSNTLKTLPAVYERLHQTNSMEKQ